jgi:hypothetical protein
MGILFGKMLIDGREVHEKASLDNQSKVGLKEDLIKRLQIDYL